MQFGERMQMSQVVKEFTSGSLPFENGEIECSDEFRRVAECFGEERCNRIKPVWQEFSGAPFEVRRVGTIGRKNVLK
jgi:hypothetical protein